jgi:hypothetical protein
MAAPKDNKNAEKWSLEVATEFMNKAVKLSAKDEYDFIGEVAKDLGSYIDVFDYLGEKFKELKPLKSEIKRNCEVNCFSNGKKGEINTAMAIMNLKSNHGWTDRQEQTIKTEQPLFGD